MLGSFQKRSFCFQFNSVYVLGIVLTVDSSKQGVERTAIGVFFANLSEKFLWLKNFELSMLSANDRVFRFPCIDSELLLLICAEIKLLALEFEATAAKAWAMICCC